VSGMGQAKLTQAKSVLDEGMKEHEAGNHKGAMDEMAQAITLITQSRLQLPLLRGPAVASCFVRVAG
jgi:hypothetical protein